MVSNFGCLRLQKHQGMSSQHAPWKHSRPPRLRTTASCRRCCPRRVAVSSHRKLRVRRPDARVKDVDVHRRQSVWVRSGCCGCRNGRGGVSTAGVAPVERETSLVQPILCEGERAAEDATSSACGDG